MQQVLGLEEYFAWCVCFCSDCFAVFEREDFPLSDAIELFEPVNHGRLRALGLAVAHLAKCVDLVEEHKLSQEKDALVLTHL